MSQDLELWKQKARSAEQSFLDVQEELSRDFTQTKKRIESKLKCEIEDKNRERERVRESTNQRIQKLEAENGKLLAMLDGRGSILEEIGFIWGGQNHQFLNN